LKHFEWLKTLLISANQNVYNFRVEQFTSEKSYIRLAPTKIAPLGYLLFIAMFIATKKKKTEKEIMRKRKKERKRERKREEERKNVLKLQCNYRSPALQG